jgi:hypothetical protein
MAVEPMLRDQWVVNGRRGVRSDDELDVSGLIQTVGSDWYCTIPILPE